MITDLSQLHQYVMIVLELDSLLRTIHIRKHCRITTNLCQKLSIEINLKLRKHNADVNFNFVRELYSQILFGSSEHEGLHDLVQLLYHLHLILLFLIRIILTEIKPICEVIFRLKKFWHKEIQQGPKFTNIILQWCSSKQKSLSWSKVSRSFGDLRVWVFEFMSFIKYWQVKLVLF